MNKNIKRFFWSLFIAFGITQNSLHAMCQICLNQLNEAPDENSSKSLPVDAHWLLCTGPQRVPHVFHLSCLLKWVMHHVNCPTCRISARTFELYKFYAQAMRFKYIRKQIEHIEFETLSDIDKRAFIDFKIYYEKQLSEFRLAALNEKPLFEHQRVLLNHLFRQ